MILNGVVALILRYFTEFGSFRGALVKVVEGVVIKKSSRSLYHPLISLLSTFQSDVVRSFKHVLALGFAKENCAMSVFFSGEAHNILRVSLSL